MTAVCSVEDHLILSQILHETKLRLDESRVRENNLRIQNETVIRNLAEVAMRRSEIEARFTHLARGFRKSGWVKQAEVIEATLAFPDAGIPVVTIVSQDRDRLQEEVERLTGERDEARQAAQTLLSDTRTLTRAEAAESEVARLRADLESMKDRDYEPLKAWIREHAPEAVRNAYAIMERAERERDEALARATPAEDARLRLWGVWRIEDGTPGWEHHIGLVSDGVQVVPPSGKAVSVAQFWAESHEEASRTGHLFVSDDIAAKECATSPAAEDALLVGIMALAKAWEDYSEAIWDDQPHTAQDYATHAKALRDLIAALATPS